MKSRKKDWHRVLGILYLQVRLMINKRTMAPLIFICFVYNILYLGHDSIYTLFWGYPMGHRQVFELLELLIFNLVPVYMIFANFYQSEPYRSSFFRIRTKSRISWFLSYQAAIIVYIAIYILLQILLFFITTQLLNKIFLGVGSIFIDKSNCSIQNLVFAGVGRLFEITFYILLIFSGMFFNVSPTKGISLIALFYLPLTFLKFPLYPFGITSLCRNQPLLQIAIVLSGIALCEVFLFTKHLSELL